MSDNDNELLTQILQTLNTFQVQTVKYINDLREEVRENKREIQKSREIENEHWQENLRRWNENDKKWEENERRWEENERRWKENDKRWEENKKLWEQNEINRAKDKQDLIDVLLRYDISISTQLGDKNVQNMKKILKM